MGSHGQTQTQLSHSRSQHDRNCCVNTYRFGTPFNVSRPVFVWGKKEAKLGPETLEPHLCCAMKGFLRGFVGAEPWTGTGGTRAILREVRG